MLKKKRYKKIRKGNFKCVNTFNLFGYENLRFQEIEAIIANYVEFHKPLEVEVQYNVNTPVEKQVGRPVIKEIPFMPDTSADKNYNTLPSVGKPVPVLPISLFEYSLKQNSPTLSTLLCKPDPRHSNLKAIASPSVGKPATSHSDPVTTPVPASSQPSIEKYLDPMVIWIILYMIHLTLIDHQDEKEWFNAPIGTPINSVVLERIFGNRRKIALAKEIVDYTNIMERFNAVHIQDVNRSDCFRVSISLRATTDLGEVIRYPVDDPKISRLLIDAYNRHLNEKPLDAVSKKSLKILQTFHIRGDEARKYIDDKFKKDINKEMSRKKTSTERLKRLQRVRDNRYAFIKSVEHIAEDAFVTRDDFSGRLYSTFTMSPKELRQFLYFEGCDEDLYIVDLSNAMAVFLAITLIEHYQKNYWKELGLEFDSVITFLQLLRKKGNCEDAIKYIMLVMDGRFYDEMYQLMNTGKKNPPAMKEEAKKKIKTGLCRHVFYGKNCWEKRIKYKAYIEKVFEKNFPNVYKVVADIKEDGYKMLAKALFQCEVSIFIDNILKQLICKEKKPFIISIHDGLLCPASDVQDIKAKLAATFKKWDIQVPISFENIRTGETTREILNELPQWDNAPLIKDNWNGEERSLWKKVG